MIKNTKKINVKNKFLLIAIVAVICVSAFFSATGKWHGVYNFFGLGENTVFASSEGVSVHFINVGQGDCALILTPEKSVLIDSGEREYSAVVINYLRAQGVTQLNFAVVSHPHSDHIGSMSSVIDELGADYIILPRVKESIVPTTSAFLRLLDSIENNGTEVIWAESGMVFELSADSKMEILAPLRQYDSLNENSVVVKFNHTAGSFLFTGDIESTAESDLADSELDINADVLAVAHHGSLTSSTAKFLNAVGGRYAVISVGSPNSYNHPREEILTRLELRGYEILRTDLHGNIIFDCTADGLIVYVQNENTGVAA
ncbi:MAG: MBL fold metallo-hydrolase [Oscillospiraceae bacterium]|jgi:competence protein ComEC|nr:MBL fold metallo-hydrolase [Oscillospiraceae bacterium]